MSVCVQGKVRQGKFTCLAHLLHLQFSVLYRNKSKRKIQMKHKEKALKSANTYTYTIISVLSLFN